MPRDMNSTHDAFLRDRVLGTTKLISSGDGRQTSGGMNADAIYLGYNASGSGAVRHLGPPLGSGR